MASASSSLSFPPLQLLRYTPSSSSAGLRPGSVYRHCSPSARLQLQPTTKGLKSATVTAAASYEDEAAAVGHHGDNGIAATTSLLRHVADEVPPAPERRVGGSGALCSPKGRPAGPPPPREDGGDGKIHASAPTTFEKRARGPAPPCLPAEGCGGNGGSKH